MANKAPKAKRGENPPAAAASAAGLWEGRLRPWLERRALPIAVLLIAIGAARIASTYSRFCFTNDEPQHFASGLEYLQQHTYRYEPEQPPLSRIAMAMGPWLDGSKMTGQHLFVDREGVAIMYQRGNPQRTLILMRLGILPFFLLAGVVVFLWARHHFGGPVAVAAIALFTLEPAILAHSGLATADMALAACLPAAFFAMVLWAERPTMRNSILFGVASGMALLAKFTALIYLPMAAVFALLYYLAVRGSWRGELHGTREAARGLLRRRGAVGRGHGLGRISVLIREIHWVWFSGAGAGIVPGHPRRAGSQSRAGIRHFCWER